MGKILERIIVKKMEEVFQGHSMQYGFTKGRCCEDAMMEVRRIVETSRHKYVMGLFLDIMGAFDRVWWPSVMRRLRMKGVRKEGYELLYDCFRRRKVEMCLGVGVGVVRKDVNLGCPQGSVLGPQVWKLLFDELVRMVNERGWKMVAFADDGVIVLCGNTRRELEMNAREVLSLIEEWMCENKMKLSVEKTVCMMLKGRFVTNPRVYLSGQALKCVKKVKYLGVEWEEGMRVQEHVVNVCNKAVRVFNGVIGMYGRVNVDCTRWMNVLYNGLFLAIVTYAAGAWGDKLNTWSRRRLRSGHRRALLRMTKAYRTISQVALEVLAGVWPLELEVERRWAAYNLRRRGEVEWRGRRIVGSRRRAALRDVCLEEWQSEWDGSEKGRWTYEWLPDVRARMSMHWLKVGHCMAQVLSGHGVFKGKLFGFGLAENAWCECSEEEEESVRHVVYECRRYEAERLRLIGALNELGMEWDVRGCLSEEGYECFRMFVNGVIGRLEAEEREERMRV